ncbi:MAG: molybdopterin-binding protein [Planctomycetia bacterium]|nr:molybdopterin-binding protein [Planctomycetia bacterium]
MEPTNGTRQIVAEIISIGDEISNGLILDTNSQYLSASLSEIGVQTLYHTTVGDDLSAMIEVLTIAARRSNVIITTGGLGPTQDDLTRQAVCQTLGLELTFDADSYRHIEELFASRGRQMPESNKIQAYFPQGAHVIYNPNGTAPGFAVESSSAKLSSQGVLPQTTSNENDNPFVVLSFPGVPAELKEMWRGKDGRDYIQRFIPRAFGAQPRYYRTKMIHTFGAGESQVEERLPNLIARDHVPAVGITAKDSIITLRIFGNAESPESCERQIIETSKIIYDTVPDLIFGEDDETLSEVVCRILRAQCRKVGLLEWGTRGKLSTLIDSDVLAFGRVFGESDRARFLSLFGKPEELPPITPQANTTSTFSARCVQDVNGASPELLELVRQESAQTLADYVLAIGPYPDGDASDPNSDMCEVVFIDLREQNAPQMKREIYHFGGHPAVIDILFCNRALNALRLYE